MDSFLDFLLPEIMDLLNEETSDSEQTLVTGQVDPAIQQEQLTEHSVHGYNLEPPTKQQKRTFAPRKNEDKVMKAKLSAIPSKTMADKKYGVNVWQQWCAHISTEWKRSYLGSYTPERNIYPSKKTKRRGISSKFISSSCGWHTTIHQD